MVLLLRGLQAIQQFRELDLDPAIWFILLCVMVLFGAVNCFLGYRLMRFWMMLGGVALGAILAYLVCQLFELPSQVYVMLISAVVGILFGVLAFFVYIAGIFAVGVGIGLTTSIYILHPTTSAVFFACLLIGLILGILAARFARVVIILATSLIGGTMAGMALNRLLKLPLFPHGLGICAGFIATGLLIQFLTNPAEDEEDDEVVEEDDDEVEYEEEYEDDDLDDEEEYEDDLD